MCVCVYRCVCVRVCVYRCVCVCVCRWRITALEGRGLGRVQGIEIQTEGEGGEGMGKEEGRKSRPLLGSAYDK